MKKKILAIGMLLLLLITIIFPQKVYSAGFSVDDIFKSGDKFIERGKQGGTDINVNDLKDTFVPIAQLLISIGGGVIAIITAIMAIKYMMANPEQRAKLKTQLVGLVIATCVIFGAHIIWMTLLLTFKDI